MVVTNDPFAVFTLTRFAAVISGEAFDPTPDNIEKRTKRGELTTGVKTAVLPKKTRAEAVVGQFTLRYGNEGSFPGLTTAAELLPTLTAQAEAHIVNVSSIFGLVPMRKIAAYQTSKFGLVGFSAALRAEYDRFGCGQY